MNSKAVILAVVVLMATDLASGGSIGYIVGGVPISIEQVPYQVSLQNVRSDGFFRHLCGGSIINEKFILTASHCLEKLKFYELAILAGETFCTREAQKNHVKRIIMHKRYDNKIFDYDVGLIELEMPLNFTDKIQPIPLADEYDEIPDDTECLVSGWGTTNQEVPPADKDKLRAVEVSTVNQETCARNNGKYGVATPRMICAGTSHKDSCQGDSGGPLVCHLYSQNGNLTLVGVVSWGKDCGMPNQPGVYARITSVRQWIRDFTGV